MNGLEAAEINFSTANVQDMRIDSEYFQKNFLENASRLHGMSLDALCDSQHKTIKKLHLKRDFNYLEISGINRAGMDYTTSVVSPDSVPDRAHVVLKNGDVAVSLVRPNRNAVTLIRNAKRTVGTSGFLILRPTHILPEYLFAYCKTKQFVLAMMRENRATMYPATGPTDALKISVFNATPKFQDKVRKIVNKSSACLTHAESILQMATNTFLSELDLENWRPDEGNTSVSKASALMEGNRWDAEYYMPKYTDIINILCRTPHKQLHELVDIHKSIEPGSEAYRENGIPFVRVANLSKFGIFAVDKHLDESEYGEVADKLSPRKNTILFSKDGTLGIAYKIEQDMRAITSGAILHLTTKSGIDPDYLTLALNAMPTQMQARRDSGGAIIQHWRPDQIEKVIIPVLPPAKRKHLATEARKSFQLRRQSESLLQTAISAVETAIEKGEKAALRMLEKHGL